MKMHLALLALLATVALLAASAAAPPTRAGVAATHAGFGIERVAYSTTSAPKTNTVYQASTAYVDRCCLVMVKVAQLLTLSASPEGGKEYIKGRLAPDRPGRVIVIQVRSGKRWKVLARVKTSGR